MARSSAILSSIIFVVFAATVSCNLEVDVLYQWKTKLSDPNNVLQSWDPTLVNPCTWFHVTCDSDNVVTRVDLGDAGISGPLGPELAFLTNLQYLEVYGNKLEGSIPKEFGRFEKLVSLDLHHNRLSGSIPTTLGNLNQVKYMRLNSNKLSGVVPREVIELVRVGNLQVLNVSDNSLFGTAHPANTTGYVVTTVIQDPKI